MRRLLVIPLLVALVACGNDNDPEVSAATTTTEEATTTTVLAKSPPPTPKPNATTTTADPGDPPGLIPADSQTPVAGSCSNSFNGIAEFALNPDIPSPRCMIVKETDHLRVENNFEFAVVVSDSSGDITSLNPGANYTHMKAFGGYYATGVHRLKVRNKATNAALYGGGGPEIWLK